MTMGYTLPLDSSSSLELALLPSSDSLMRLPTPSTNFTPAWCTRSDIDGRRAGVDVDVLDVETDVETEEEGISRPAQP